MINKKENEMFFEQPPFPPLKIETDSLEGKDFFASWQGFQANGEALNGEIRIVVITAESADNLPSAVQTNAYRFLRENEAQVTAAILDGLFADYPQIREVYGGIEDEYLPEISVAEYFCRLIKPLSIYINEQSKDGFAYIGIEFDCLWDEEHGLGVMTRQSEYIGCNDAPAAWSLDLAQS